MTTEELNDALWQLDCNLPAWDTPLRDAIIDELIDRARDNEANILKTRRWDGWIAIHDYDTREVNVWIYDGRSYR